MHVRFLRTALAVALVAGFAAQTRAADETATVFAAASHRGFTALSDAFTAKNPLA
jgi:ABC-type molybdate transport system substrate-binding protein